MRRLAQHRMTSSVRKVTTVRRRAESNHSAIGGPVRIGMAAGVLTQALVRWRYSTFSRLLSMALITADTLYTVMPLLSTNFPIRSCSG